MEDILRVMVSEVVNRSEHGLETIRWYGDHSERALRRCRFGYECQRTDVRHFSLQRHDGGHPLLGQPVHGSNGFLLASLPSCTHHLVGGCAIGSACRFFHPTGREATRAIDSLDVFPKRGHAYNSIAGTETTVARRKRFSGASAPLRGAAFRRFVVEELGAIDDVVDVGGGGRAGATGGVAWQLCNFRGAQRCFIVDPRPADFRVAEDTFRRSPTSKLREGDQVVVGTEPKRPPQVLERVDESSLSDWINSPLMHSAKAIVGLHPDSATLTIVKLALSLNISFAVVPCCVCFRSVSELNKNNVRSYEQLLDYLQSLHPDIQRKALPFPGRNIVLFMKSM